MNNYFRDLTKNGYKRISSGHFKFIPTGFQGIDFATNDLMSRKCTIITGRSEEGKSIIVHRIILNAIDKGLKVLIVDGEYDQEELINELYLKVIGNNSKYYDTIRMNKLEVKEPKPHILDMLRQWHKDKLYIISKNKMDDGVDFNSLFDIIESTVEGKGIDLVVLDNMMSLVDSAQSELNANQKRFVQRVIRMNRNKDCHSVIVNHLRKPKGDRSDEPSVIEMSGTMDMFNLVDNVMLVVRNWVKKEPWEPDGWLKLEKNKLNGKHASIELLYDHETRNYLEVKGDQAIAVNLNWKGGKQTEWNTKDKF